MVNGPGISVALLLLAQYPRRFGEEFRIVSPPEEKPKLRV
jgi:hypothetical protein